MSIFNVLRRWRQPAPFDTTLPAIQTGDYIGNDRRHKSRCNARAGTRVAGR